MERLHRQHVVCRPSLPTVRCGVRWGGQRALQFVADFLVNSPLLGLPLPLTWRYAHNLEQCVLLQERRTHSLCGRHQQVLGGLFQCHRDSCRLDTQRP